MHWFMFFHQWFLSLYLFGSVVPVQIEAACVPFLKCVHLQYKGVENPTNSLTLFTLINKQNVCHIWNPIIFITTLHNGAIRLLFFFIVILQPPSTSYKWDKGYMQMHSLYLIRQMLMKNVVSSSFYKTESFWVLSSFRFLTIWLF